MINFKVHNNKIVTKERCPYDFAYTRIVGGGEGKRNIQDIYNQSINQRKILEENVRNDG